MQKNIMIDDVVIESTKQLIRNIDWHCLDKEEIEAFCDEMQHSLNSIKMTATDLMVMREFKENRGRDMRKDFQ